MMAVALARRTMDTNAKLLVMGDAVPLYNPPVRIAEELAMLDVMSGGRLITGFPLGSSQDANFAYGAKPATMREMHREGFDLVMRAWTSDEVFAHNGRFSKLKDVNPWPKPLQKLNRLFGTRQWLGRDDGVRRRVGRTVLPALVLRRRLRARHVREVLGRCRGGWS